MYFVRTAGERDLDKVRALLGETWHATYDRLYGADKVDEIHASWHSVAALKARLEKMHSEFVVADSGKEIGGMGYATMSAEMAKTALLHMLYVRPSLQRQGIGRDLFAELETCFPDAELMRVEVALSRRARRRCRRHLPDDDHHLAHRSRLVVDDYRGGADARRHARAGHRRPDDRILHR
jgi:GNAT superfamily N-acetyltransferase